MIATLPNGRGSGPIWVVLSLTALLVAGCAYGAAGTTGQAIPVAGPQAASDAHATRTMLVQFHDGSVYSYAPVPAAVWDDFIAAQPHPWSRVGNPVLVEGGVRYRKLR